MAALALDDGRPRAWLARRLRADGGFDEKDGRPDGPTSSALAALALADRRAARRALGYAIAHRGLPLPNARDPEKREAWGWTDDARSLTEPTARVLLAVNALTPDDAATRREAVGLLTARQCADGGWNFGNASVYDVDLRGYVQTTAIGLIALQRGDAQSSRAPSTSSEAMAARARRPDRRAGARGLPAAWPRRRGSRARRRSRDDRAASVVPRETTRGRLGGARDRPGPAPRAAEVARMSMTRSSSSCAAAQRRSGRAPGGVRRRKDGRVRHAAQVRPRRLPEARAAPPSPCSEQRPTTATSRASSSTGCGSSGRRAREARPAQAEPRRVRQGRVDQHRPADGRGRRERIRRLGASSVVVAEGPGHRRDTEAIAFASGLRDALDDAGLRFVDLNDAPLVRTPLETRYTGLRRALGAERPARDGGRRLDAEAQDPPLGRA